VVETSTPTPTGTLPVVETSTPTPTGTLSVTPTSTPYRVSTGTIMPTAGAGAGGTTPSTPRGNYLILSLIGVIGFCGSFMVPMKRESA
jgi:hypothetical protein